MSKVHQRVQSIVGWKITKVLRLFKPESLIDRRGHR